MKDKRDELKCLGKGTHLKDHSYNGCLVEVQDGGETLNQARINRMVLETQAERCAGAGLARTRLAHGSFIPFQSSASRSYHTQNKIGDP